MRLAGAEGAPTSVVGSGPLVATVVAAVCAGAEVVLALVAEALLAVSTEPTEVLTMAGSWMRLEGSWLGCFWAGWFGNGRAIRVGDWMRLVLSR